MGIPHNSSESTNKTPFNLAFGIKVMIPIKIGLLIANRVLQRVEQFNPTLSQPYLLEKTRNQAHIQMVIYRQRVTRYYNSHGKSKIFHLGDLVLW